MLSSVILAYILGLCFFSSHHEHRFLVACLPVLHLLVAWVIYRHYVSKGYITSGRCRNIHLSNVTTSPTALRSRSKSKDFASKQHHKQEKYYKIILFSGITLTLVALIHVAGAYYLLRYHQAGTESALRYISGELKAKETDDRSILDKNQNRSKFSVQVILAAPCFAFPSYSYLHSEFYDVHVEALPCPAPW